MLAAAMDQSSALGLFQVVLRIVENRGTPVSDPLQAHTLEVLQQASAVVADPRTIDADTPAEAIELALHIRRHQDLSNKLAAVKKFDALSPDLARELLETLQARAA